MPPMRPGTIRPVATIATMTASIALMCVSSCASSDTISPLTHPDADRDIRVVVVVPGGDSPTRITLDGEDVCGGKVSPCPGSGVLDGAAEGRMTVFVSPGSHVLTVEIPKAVGGAHIDEEERLTLEAAPETSYLCHVRDGCAPQEPSDDAPVEQESSASEAECRLNSDCELGLQCKIGECVPLCREDRDCAKGQHCGPGPDGYDECLDTPPPG